MKKLSTVPSPVVDVMPVEPETDESNQLSPVDDGLAMACVSPDTNDTNDTSETNGLRTVEEILAEARESAARRAREDAWPDV